MLSSIFDFVEVLDLLLIKTTFEWSAYVAKANEKKINECVDNKCRNNINNMSDINSATSDIEFSKDLTIFYSTTVR